MILAPGGKKTGASTIYNTFQSMTFVHRGTFTHTNGPKPELYPVTHMTKSLKDPSLRDYRESNGPERLTRRCSQHTFGVETLLNRTKCELSATSPDDADSKQVQIKYFPLPEHHHVICMWHPVQQRQLRGISTSCRLPRNSPSTAGLADIVGCLTSRLLNLIEINATQECT